MHEEDLCLPNSHSGWLTSGPTSEVGQSKDICWCCVSGTQQWLVPYLEGLTGAQLAHPSPPGKPCRWKASQAYTQHVYLHCTKVVSPIFIQQLLTDSQHRKWQMTLILVSNTQTTL